MSEREMLEYAARVCGLEHHRYCDSRKAMAKYTIRDGWFAATWNPYKDEGDCARMEATLGIDVEWSDRFNEVSCSVVPVVAACDYTGYGSKQAARRMASLRVAAQIGRQIK